MKALRVLPIETISSLEYAWPYPLWPRDPWAGDEATPEPADYKNYLDFGVREGEAALPEDEWRALDEGFMRLYRAVLDGEQPWSALDAPARRLGLAGPASHDRRPLDQAPERISDAVLADHVEDWMPDVGLLSRDRVLGPWSDERLPAWVRRVAGASVAFSKLVNPGVSPVHRVGRARPKPERPHRIALRIIGESPPCVWSVGADGSLTPVIPISRHARPAGPVSGVPRAPAVIGRAVKGPDGWFLSAALPLPGAPPRAGLVRRLMLELLRHRRIERRASWEDLLRGRSELVYRSALSWAWLQLKDGEAPWSWPAP